MQYAMAYPEQLSTPPPEFSTPTLLEGHQEKSHHRTLLTVFPDLRWDSGVYTSGLMSMPGFRKFL